jgi:hypothetical protein
VRGGDLVGRDVVAQLGIVGRIFIVPGQVFAGQLALDQFRVFGEEEDAPLQANFVWAFAILRSNSEVITILFYRRELG